LLVLDCAYTQKMLFQRKIEAFFLKKNCAGVFTHVWHCNPLEQIFSNVDDPERYGLVSISKYNKTNSLIAGKMGLTKAFYRFPRLNFLLAQLNLFYYLSILCRQRPIRLIRADDPFFNGLLGLILAICHRLPLVVGVWGNLGRIRLSTKKPIMPKLFPKIWIEEKIETSVLKHSTSVIVANKDNKKYVMQLGISPKKISLFNMGSTLNIKHFQNPRQRAGILPKKCLPRTPFILVISRLEKIKYVDHVIMALPKIAKKVSNIKLLLVGDGAERKNLFLLAEELGVLNRISICGNQNQEWLAKVIPRASVVVAPLSGRSLAEAALGGAPIVAYDLDWHNEIIINNKTGRLVPFHDIHGLARETIKILKNPAKAKNMGRMARRRALSLLDPEKASLNQKKLYESIKKPN